MAGRSVFVSVLLRWLRQPHARLFSLILLVLIVPVCLRAALGWSSPLGYLSDLAVGSLLLMLLHRRAWWLGLPLLLFWGLLVLLETQV